MPSPDEHAKLSKARTGKSFIELHEWMDEEHNLPIHPRHDITKIPKNIDIVKLKFCKSAIQEFLYHIKEDYENNKVHKAVRLLAAIKRKACSPLNIFKKSNN